MRSTGKDFLLWFFWLATFSAISLAAIAYWVKVNNDPNSANNYTDQTGVTFVIIALFLLALLINIVNTITIQWECTNVKQNGARSSLFKQHIKNLEKVARNSLQIDQQFSLEVIENRLIRKENWVQLFAGLLITLGMIGTVLGLTFAMSGLSEAIDGIRVNMQSSEMSDLSDMAASLSGLGDALAGMSSAFITTLVGAFFGGLFLKILSHSTNNLIEDLLDRIRFVTEVEHLPKLQRQAWQRELRNLSTANRDLKTFIDRSQQIDSLLNQYTYNMTKASQGMSSVTDHLELRMEQQLKTMNSANERLELRMEEHLKTMNFVMKNQLKTMNSVMKNQLKSLSETGNVDYHKKLLTDLNKTVLGLNHLTAFFAFLILVLVAAFVVGFVFLYRDFL